MRKIILRNCVKTVYPLLILLVFSKTLFSQPVIQFESVATGFNQPIEVATAPGDATGRLFIVEKPGLIRIWNGTMILPTAFLDISAIVSEVGEQGLLSMAFHPQYQANGFFFVYYTDNSGSLTIARYQVSGNPNVANPTPNPLTPILNVPKLFQNHNGGHIQFKVQGGVNYLYVGTGDGGSANDPDNNAQNPASMLGKIIRFNADNLALPPEIWAWGLRNPFKWSFDRLTGDLLIADVGQNLREEVNFRAGGTIGANYGWVCFEADLVNATAPTGIQCDTVAPVHVLPIFSYANPALGQSIVGGYVYRGSEFPSLFGYYTAHDFFSGRMWLIRNDGPGTWSIFPQVGLPTMISSISETSDGSTLYATQLTTGIIYKITTSLVTPVRLTGFSGIARDGYNELKWTTETEQNIEKYIIEYSQDSRNYSSGGEVAAVNNNNRNVYAFRHNIVADKLFYRLQIKEQIGHSSYSPIITLGGTDRSKTIVYPTVIPDNRLNILSRHPVEKILMISSDGRMVFSKTLNAQTGYFTLTIPPVANGIYFIQISGGSFSQTEKVIIQ